MLGRLREGPSPFEDKSVFKCYGQHPEGEDTENDAEKCGDTEPGIRAFGM